MLASLVFGVLSSIPLLEDPDYLTLLSSIELQVLSAIFFQATMAVAYTGIAALFYPLLKNYNEQLATAYLAFRVIGAGFLFAGIGPLILLLWLSKSFFDAGLPDVSHFQMAGELLRQGRDILNHIGMIMPWSIGGLILYYCVYRTALIPRWLAVWGMLGSASTLIATVLLMLKTIPLVDPIYFLLNAPIAFCELLLAFVLIVRGFDSPSIQFTSDVNGGP